MPLYRKNLSKVKNWLIPFSALFLTLAYLSYATLSSLIQPVKSEIGNARNDLS